MPRIIRLLLLTTLTVAGLAGGLVVGAQNVPGPSGAGEPQPPEVNAGRFVILSDFNEVLYERNAHERTPPASLTKMMTAIVAVRYLSLDTVVTIHQDDLVGEATMGLVAGDQVTIGDLLYGLLLPSGNDAAMAIARGVGLALGAPDNASALDEFVRLMNVTAMQFQLRDTHFMNPHGLDREGHYSSAYDLAIILRAALNYPQISARMQTLSIRVGERYDLYNGNHLLTDRSDYIGGKTGLTDGCGFCLAGAARDESGRTVIAVALDDDWSWFWDVSLLLDYGFELEQLRGIPAWADPTLVGSQFAQLPDPTSPTTAGAANQSGGQ
jgi:D-alanyl-D-alanine carboxypeptidase (penicillin-binding protein 5/6)